MQIDVWDIQLQAFDPAEPGWVVALLSVPAADGEPGWFEVYGLLAWATIQVEALPKAFPAVVPVTTGNQGEGQLDINYEPTDRFKVFYAPGLFDYIQAHGPQPIRADDFANAIKAASE